MNNDKLIDGDFFEGGTVEQYRELLEIEGTSECPLRYSNTCFQMGGVTYNRNLISGWGLFRGVHGGFKKHSFTDFRRKAINTFKAK